jgi:hypothetical protein
MGNSLAWLRGQFRRGSAVTTLPKTGDVQVFLKRRDTGAPVPHARVRLAGAGAPGETLLTDERGAARWSSRKLGKYVVSVAFLGDDPRKYEAPRTHTLSVPQQQPTQIVVDLVDRKLRLILVDADDRPIANCSWSFSSPFTKQGTTGADGMIEVSVGVDHSHAQLAVAPPVLHQAPQPGAVATTPAYPPAIDGTHFLDEASGPALPEADRTDCWDLDLVSPDKPQWKGQRSLKHRLHNLGFAVDVDSDAEVTKAAVEAYQARYTGTSAGGRLADIGADLKRRCDKP